MVINIYDSRGNVVREVVETVGVAIGLRDFEDNEVNVALRIDKKVTYVLVYKGVTDYVNFIFTEFAEIVKTLSNENVRNWFVPVALHCSEIVKL